MKKSTLILAVFAVLMISCKENPKFKQAGSGDAPFQKLSEEFLTGYLAWRPQLSVYLGLHEYDGKITDFSKPSLDAELARLKSYEQKLSAIDSASLSPKMFYDLRILLSAIRNEIFNFEDLQVFNKNPTAYFDFLLLNGWPAFDLSIYIYRNFAPLEERVRSIIALEKELRKIIAAAKSNLSDSLPTPYIETAIITVNGIAEFAEKDLVFALKEVKNDSLMTAFNAVNKMAAEELKGYVQYLEKEKLPKATNYYAIGKKNYQKMLLVDELITLSPERILQIGMTELKREQDAFNAAAKIINPNIKPVDVYSAMQKEHPAAENLISEEKDKVETIRRFLIDKKIVTIPSDVRVRVEEMPPYARSYMAMADIPGPFEKVATEAYYYITPVDPRWTARQKEDWLKVFDYYTTDVITFHEAYPGHYVQYLHVNASPVSKIEKIFGSYAFTEGWAHYAEQMMIDEGFGNNGDPIMAAKYRLAQSGEALCRICRYCVSVKMHCEGMKVDEATRFFMDNWHRAEVPSRLEAMRATYDPRYLFYTLGKLQMLKLRKDYQKQEGDNFSLQNFHDLIIDNGMPPIQLLRERLLKDKNTWDDIL
jgi:uncharacterized protein (DUF885 family)